MEEASKDKVESIEDHPVLKYFEYAFREISGLSPNRDIDFSIDLVLGDAPVSKTHYRMGTLELKELRIYLEEMLKKGIYAQVCHLGEPQCFS